MATAPKSDQVTTPAEEALMVAEMLREAGVAPEKAVEIVNNAAQYGSMDAIFAAAGLAPPNHDPAMRATLAARAMPSKYEGFPNVINAWNWYIAAGYDEIMTELWLDDRINRGGLYKDSRSLISSYNPRALLKVPAARMAES